MKVLFVLFSVIIQFFQPINYVSADNTTAYAQVLQNECYLFKTPSDNTNYTNVYFMLEQSYFVELINEYYDFYKAKYMDIIGYVKKSQVQCVQGTPREPFLENISFRVYNNSREMYDKPFSRSNDAHLKILLPVYCTDLIYYGKIYGESTIEERTNIWYFCKYTVTNECGYVYSDSCDQMDEIIKNNEKLPYIATPQWNITSTNSNELIKVNSNPFKITIVLICIPFVIFAFLLIKFAYNKQSSKNEVKPFDPFE